MVSRNSRRYLQTTLFFGSILVILALASTRLFHTPTAASEPSHSPVVITEFMTANETVLADEDGEYADWIELYNRSGRRINLLGWSLTDDPNQPNKWMLPNIDLPAGHYVVIFASGKTAPGLSTGLKKPGHPS